MPTAKVSRRHNLSPATFYKLKAKFDGMEISDASRLKDAFPLRSLSLPTPFS